MQTLSRRNFARRLAAASLLPVLASPSRAQTETPSLPATVAGYTPDATEREAMAKFLADQEKSLAPLRAVTLPNDLAPATVFRAPYTRNASRGAKQP